MAFYDLHPYPPPVDDLDGYRQRWQDEGRRRADFHLHWPDKAYRADLKVLVAGCGTAQAANMPCASPPARWSASTSAQTSVRHTETLKRKYHLTNLEVYQLPVERVGELGRRFDKIVCTGVLHHLPDPDAGLRALREVLEPDGAMHLMVYAAYGRAGVYMLQDYCRRLGDRAYGQGDPGPGRHAPALPQDPSAGAPAGRVRRISAARKRWPMRCSTRRIAPTPCRSSSTSLSAAG